MEKVYYYNPDRCTYEEVEKPFMMHNMMLLTLLLTSFIFFMLTCYYHAQNEKTLELVPGIAKNCFSEVEHLRSEIKTQKKLLQQVKNQQYMLPGAIIRGENKSLTIPAQSQDIPIPLKKIKDPATTLK
jgi:hypothetical protein